MNDVREILLKQWDPLDIGDNPQLSNEYDAYVTTIAGLLASEGASYEAIDKQLSRIEHQEMGIHGLADRRHAAAEALLNLPSKYRGSL